MRIITEKKLATFKAWLMEQEMATGSLQNYLRYVRSFAAFAEGHEVDHELVVSWKAYLQQKGNQAATVNAKLVGLNAFLSLSVGRTAASSCSAYRNVPSGQHSGI